MGERNQGKQGGRGGSRQAATAYLGTMGEIKPKRGGGVVGAVPAQWAKETKENKRVGGRRRAGCSLVAMGERNQGKQGGGAEERPEQLRHNGRKKPRGLRVGHCFDSWRRPPRSLRPPLRNNKQSRRGGSVVLCFRSKGHNGRKQGQEQRQGGGAP